MPFTHCSSLKASPRSHPSSSPLPGILHRRLISKVPTWPILSSPSCLYPGVAVSVRPSLTTLLKHCNLLHVLPHSLLYYILHVTCHQLPQSICNIIYNIYATSVYLQYICNIEYVQYITFGLYAVV